MSSNEDNEISEGEEQRKYRGSEIAAIGILGISLATTKVGFSSWTNPAEQLLNGERRDDGDWYYLK